MPATRSRQVLIDAGAIAGLAAVYFTAGKLGLSLARVHPNATAVWPPTGIALAALLILQPRVWPGVFLGAFLVNLTTAGTVGTSIGIAIGNTLEAIIAASLVRWFAHGRHALEQPADIFKFIGLAAITSTMVSATIGVATLAVAGFAPWENFAAIWLTWWLGDMSGALIVAPLLLLWSVRPRRRLAPREWLETALLALCVLLVGLAIFGGILSWSRDNHPLAFLALPPLLWMALRVGQRAAVTAACMLSAIALWGTVQGFGPFAGVSARESLVMLQVFLGFVTVTVLLIGALVSERRRALERARQARVEAEDASRFKDDFLAVVSHELRNPLNVILGYADLLERQQSFELSFVREAAAAIRRNAKAQAQVVSDLLDLSRMQTGKLTLNHQLVSLPTLVAEAVSAMQPEAEVRAIELVTEIEADDCTVMADSVRLQQVIWNLVHNAIKFTPQGGRILVRLQRDGDQAELVVEDTGAGIPPEFLPYIFDMFRQADTTKTRRYGGMGIGLALVRQLAERHGGRVAAASDGAGEGARFTVWLPCEPRRATVTTRATDSSAARLALANLRVLVVDDTREVAEMLARMLRLEGAVVSIALGAGEALRRSEESSFDVILSDVAMPEMDGCELLRALRLRPATATVPAIALTGFGRQSEIEATRAAGFALHLVKPVPLRDLVDAIRQTLPKRPETPVLGD